MEKDGKDGKNNYTDSEERQIAAVAAAVRAVEKAAKNAVEMSVKQFINRLATGATEAVVDLGYVPDLSIVKVTDLLRARATRAVINSLVDDYNAQVEKIVGGKHGG